MKKKTLKIRGSKNPLHLDRKTVRRLQGQQLHAVVGGPTLTSTSTTPTCH